MLNRLVNFLIFDPSAKVASTENGTGPYRIKPGTTNSATELQLVAVDNYHGGEVYTKEVQIKGISGTDTIIDQLNKNEFDIAGNLKLDNLAALDKNNFYTLKNNAVAVFAIWPSGFKQGSPAQKKEVRQAIYRAIDINKFIEVTKTDAVPASQITTPEVAGYNPSIKRPERSIEEAKKLLTTAGYPNGVNLEMVTVEVNKVAAEELHVRWLKPA